jgi:spore photoproduct lyase
MDTPLIKEIETAFNFRLNKNQLRDIERLIFEIQRREKTSIEQILSYLKNTSNAHKHSGKEKFFFIKQALIRRRFPKSSCQLNIKAKDVFLPPLRQPLQNNYQPIRPFEPETIFVEKAVKNSWLVKNFQKAFPKITVQEIDYYSIYLKSNPFDISQLKKPMLFLVKENWDFLKPCPCTSGHVACGYWILNLGFGCPFDCSYCFLQQYTNFPGLLLPANLDDFFTKFDDFEKKLSSPIRIGTGEFCDSLALDHISGYSKKLIPYFSKKNVLFELKTKSNNISNLLNIKPGSNIVISWSLNPQSIIDEQELCAASLDERLAAAKTLQSLGYKIGFHFDPIIPIDSWQKLYTSVIEKIYSVVKSPLAWISLGTLRSHRELKTISEQRFPQSDIFYGELLLGQDKKLRYPEFLRKDIYRFIIKTIRIFDEKTPIYLCMENESVWQELLGTSSTQEIEKNLLFKI